MCIRDRLGSEDVEEVIIATNPNIEGETTASYLARIIKPLGITVTRLASGLPVGGDLEYADELTLGRACLLYTSIALEQGGCGGPRRGWRGNVHAAESVALRQWCPAGCKPIARVVARGIARFGAGHRGGPVRCGRSCPGSGRSV